MTAQISAITQRHGKHRTPTGLVTGIFQLQRLTSRIRFLINARPIYRPSPFFHQINTSALSLTGQLFTNILDSPIVIMKLASALVASAFFISPTFALLWVRHSVDGLRISSEVTNDGTEAVTLVDHPESVVGSQFKTDIFTFRSAEGNSPEFTGIALKWNPEAAERFLIKPGETKTFVQDVTESYDFSKSGESEYTVGGGSEFFVISPEGRLARRSAAVVPTTAKVEGIRATRKREHTPVYGSLSKRSTYPGCTPAQIDVISRAAAAARNYMMSTLSYTGSVTASTPRYAQWFGEFDHGRRLQVMDHFSRMAFDATSSITSYDCTTCQGSPLFSIYAYVQPNNPYKFFLCDAFWAAPLTGSNSKAGTIIHGLSHFTDNGATRDFAVGKANAHALALSDPAQAVMNADSHEFYAENKPFLS